MRPETTWRQNTCFHMFCFFSKSDVSEYFRIDGRDVTITIYRACAQDFSAAGGGGAVEIGIIGIPNTEATPPEPPSRDCFGNKAKYWKYTKSVTKTTVVASYRSWRLYRLGKYLHGVWEQLHHQENRFVDNFGSQSQQK